MKALRYISSVVAAATLFAACEKQDDDMPQIDIEASTAPVLATMSDAIDGSEEAYTFYFTPGKFVVDGQEVTLGAKDNRTQYALQVDMENGDFSSPATVEKQNYDSTDKFTVNYDAICSAVCNWNTELASPVKSWTGNLQYRVLILPGSNPADGFASEPITVPTVIKYVDPNPRFYICNNAGWEDVRLYAWGDENDAIGTWPGLEPAETVEVNGKTYYAFDIKEKLGNKNEHLIANNNDKGVQINDIFVGVFSASVYVTINEDLTFTIDSETSSQPEPEPEPIDDSNLPEYVKASVSGSKVIVETDKDIVLYVWAWNDTEGLGQLTEAGWPGDKLTLTSSNDGKFTYEYDFATAAAVPEQFIISTDNDVKFFDGVPFADNEAYEWNKANLPEPEPVEPVDPELLKNLTFTFKTDTEGDYYVWAWGGDFGGDAFTESGSWPGDKLELKSSENGEYIYGYSFTKTPGILPTNIIISTDGGDTKIYDGVEFENGKEY